MLSVFTLYAETYPELEKKLKNALTTIDFQPTLAFGFVSVKQPINDIMSLFNRFGIDLFGASSSGEILFDNENDNLSDGAMAFILTDMNKEYYSLDVLSRNKSTPFEFGENIGDFCKTRFPEPSIIISTSGLDLDGEAMVRGIKEKLGDDVKMFGGLAGDDGRFEETFVFNDNEITNNGAVILTLDKKHVKLSGMAFSGWIGLGAELTVTRSEGNIVYEIDNEPALEIYKKYLNVSEDDLPSIGLEYPIMIIKEGVEYGPLRAVVNVDKEKKSLFFAGSVPQGSTISFSTSPGFEILENTREKIIEFYEQNPMADFLILFSCIARHMALGPMISSEIKLASIKWGKPVIGFFTYGEIGSSKGNQCDFHNQTFTLAAINVI